jgi:hypothetical protein
MRAMQSCNTAVTAGRAMPITRATTFSTSGLLGRLLLHWLLRWCAGLVRAEIRFLIRDIYTDKRICYSSSAEDGYVFSGNRNCLRDIWDFRVMFV